MIILHSHLPVQHSGALQSIVEGNHVEIILFERELQLD